MTQYKFYTALPVITAETDAEAEDKAYALLQYFAQCNDGSEFLANADILIKEDL
jgi:alkanesulfonate monooxygenase SsuD/methylene tetrahydromethanopterin reductase-like flavin-dependent oxidoreductase (luciferase family)